MTREEFHRLVWSTPITEIADTFNLMPGDVREVIALFEVPLPGRGHWIQTDGRQAPSKAPPLAPHSQPEALPSVWPLQKPGKAKSGRYGLFVPQVAPRALHPVAKATAAAIRQAPDPTSIVVDAPGTFPCRTKAEDGERAVCFIDALLKLFDRLKFEISSDDVLEVRCFGVWFAFDLTYRGLKEGRDRSNVDKKVLQVRPLSPAFTGRQWGAFYGRGDKPIEATFNTILLWLMNTARAIQDAEAGWSEARFKAEGTTAQRFAERRNRAKIAAEKAAAEAKAIAKSDAEAAERAAVREAEAERRRRAADPSEPIPKGATYEDLRARRNARKVYDRTAVMTKQEKFLWYVQTLLPHRLIFLKRENPSNSKNSYEEHHLSLILASAINASSIIPYDLHVFSAANDFFNHYLPDQDELDLREEEGDYEAPTWLGEPTRAEQEAFDALPRDHFYEEEDEADDE